MNSNPFYPIGIPGQAWGEYERKQWRARQSVQRRYAQDVVPRIEAMADQFDIVTYGQLDYADDIYPLFALRNGAHDPALPTAFVTGGVHGYETSGIMGALEFLETRAADYVGKINLLVAPCVSPGPTSALIVGITTRWIPIATSRQAAKRLSVPR
ncbi:hypothetical protein [Sphingopyxis sp. BSNA05]|uniref:hypothetical protein n=1 Tax=Sphingopyxis sp. BSNA05 TaxID=1236614 RepID=UPI001C2672D4|nr:hypothetical protein [Sphingopyxis sp. BSNA05]